MRILGAWEASRGGIARVCKRVFGNGDLVRSTRGERVNEAESPLPPPPPVFLNLDSSFTLPSALSLSLHSLSLSPRQTHNERHSLRSLSPHCTKKTKTHISANLIISFSFSLPLSLEKKETFSSLALTPPSSLFLRSPSLQLAQLRSRGAKR